MHDGQLDLIPPVFGYNLLWARFNRTGKDSCVQYKECQRQMALDNGSWVSETSLALQIFHLAELPCPTSFILFIWGAMPSRGRIKVKVALLLEHKRRVHYQWGFGLQQFASPICPLWITCIFRAGILIPCCRPRSTGSYWSQIYYQAEMRFGKDDALLFPNL